VNFRFHTKELERLYTEEKGARKYPPAVVDKFFDLMAMIAAAPDEQDLRQLKSLRFKKLRGQRHNDYSMRLNKQYRLIVTFETDDKGRRIVVLEISKHYE
jgi:toxin HigB-1